MIHIKLCSPSGPTAWDGTVVAVSRVPIPGEGVEIGGHVYIVLEVVHATSNHAEVGSAKVFIRAK